MYSTKSTNIKKNQIMFVSKFEIEINYNKTNHLNSFSNFGKLSKLSIIKKYQHVKQVTHVYLFDFNSPKPNISMSRAETRVTKPCFYNRTYKIPPWKDHRKTLSSIRLLFFT